MCSSAQSYWSRETIRKSWSFVLLLIYSFIVLCKLISTLSLPFPLSPLSCLHLPITLPSERWAISFPFPLYEFVRDTFSKPLLIWAMILSLYFSLSLVGKTAHPSLICSLKLISNPPSYRKSYCAGASLIATNLECPVSFSLSKPQENGLSHPCSLLYQA